MTRQSYSDLPAWERKRLEMDYLESFLAAGHSYADECPEEDRRSHIAFGARAKWERAHRNRLERWADGHYGMDWHSHKAMFVNNYIGHRNSCTYVGGPKFYIPPRRGPILRFLRWLQVVPPRRMTVGDRAKILNKEPWT